MNESREIIEETLLMWGFHFPFRLLIIILLKSNWGEGREKSWRNRVQMEDFLQ
jgi:hypothetical protein